MEQLDELIEIILRLRAECPWDREQTTATVRPLVLNEAYELDEALGSGGPDEIREELGDYLFVGLFLADLLRTERDIALKDVLAGVIAKLKHRHPHIYGQVSARTADQVLQNWERLKQEEKKTGGARASILDGLPQALPALKQAGLLQERCRRVGFDWTDPEDVLNKVSEEIRELREQLDRTPADNAKVAEELGDLLFALVNLARHLKVDAESALRDANAKFSRRFRQVEDELRQQGTRLEDSSLAEMDEAWNRVKQAEREPGRPRSAPPEPDRTD